MDSKADLKVPWHWRSSCGNNRPLIEKNDAFTRLLNNLEAFVLGTALHTVFLRGFLGQMPVDLLLDSSKLSSNRLTG